jgi:hypothetical protein
LSRYSNCRDWLAPVALTTTLNLATEGGGRCDSSSWYTSVVQGSAGRPKKRHTSAGDRVWEGPLGRKNFTVRGGVAEVITLVIWSKLKCSPRQHVFVPLTWRIISPKTTIKRLIGGFEGHYILSAI